MIRLLVADDETLIRDALVSLLELEDDVEVVTVAASGQEAVTAAAGPRMVPPHMMRTLYFTSRTVTAQQLHNWGTVYDVVPRDQLDAAARDLAESIAAKDTRVIRAAKEAINHIDPVDVKSSYRMEQGFTFELNLAGVADEHRDEFVKTGQNLDKRAERGSHDTSTERTGENK